MTIGVVALQGAVREHAALLEAEGAVVRSVRTPVDLDGVDALVLPGGESTAMARLARPHGLFEAIRSRIDEGLPVLGTCAGLILLADVVADPAALAGLPTVGGLSVTVRRNAFGNQLASGVDEVRWADGSISRGVFIRAPRIEVVGDGIEVLATRAGEPVAVRQGALFACAYHPELAADPTLHRRLIAAASQVAAA